MSKQKTGYIAPTGTALHVRWKYYILYLDVRLGISVMTYNRAT